MPAANEYGFVEAMQQREAAKLGMTSAQYQASGWIPSRGSGMFVQKIIRPCRRALFGGSVAGAAALERWAGARARGAKQLLLDANGAP